MKKAILLSVITAVLNNKNSIQRTIDSVKSQNCPNVEHIIIDGGSTDGTLDIIKKNEDSIRWISEKDNGIYEAMNKGINLSHGEWLLFLNADDYLNERVINEVFFRNKVNNFDLIYGAMIFIGESYKVRMSKRNLTNLRKPLAYNHPSTFFKRKFLDKFNGYNPDYKISGDYDLFLKMAKTSYNHFYINKTIAFMTSGGISDRASSVFIMLWEHLKIDSENISVIFAIKNFLFHRLPIYSKLILKKIMLKLGLNKVITLYFKRKYKGQSE